MSIIDDLTWRGVINQQTDADGLRALTDEKSIALYCGVDPTADSMHIGNLITLMVLKRFQLAGHQPIAVIGGATGSVGDPSGRDSERTLQSMDTIKKNSKKITEQMKFLFNRDGLNNFKILNNYDWISTLSLLDFLRDYGKHFNVNTMLAKDIVASRLDVGISFTEFAYQILQSIDFLYLYQNHEVNLQIGGADQWGNITSGLDFIRRIEGPEAKAFGLTVPLLLTADGTKLGKSSGNSIWLDAEKTSPYEFYQFWFNQADADVIKFLKHFTFLNHEEIEEYEVEVAEQPHKRKAQKRLAEEVTKFVHGEEALKDAQRITEAFFTEDFTSLSAKQIEQSFKNMPQHQAAALPENLAIWLVDTGIINSRRQSREFIENGAISINGEKIVDTDYTLQAEEAIDGQYFIIRRGKKNYYLVSL